MRRIEPSCLPVCIIWENEAHRALLPPWVLIVEEHEAHRASLPPWVFKRGSCWEESLPASLGVNVVILLGREPPCLPGWLTVDHAGKRASLPSWVINVDHAGKRASKPPMVGM